MNHTLSPDNNEIFKWNPIFVMKPQKAFSLQMCLTKDMSKNHLKLNTNC